ncbi:MAG: OpgC domain-containing protein, partial [Acidobacteriaceae bacterium]|nr:OpgC domain-containing protein [Acidobacteriaceae bacterium]
NQLHLPPWLLRLSIVIAAIFLVLRYSPVDHWMDTNLLGWLIDKWHLGAARVINFAAITIVLVRFGSRIASLKIFAPLALLGQASLEVFCVHVLCCIAGDLLSHEADPQLPPFTQAMLLVLTVSLLFITALARKRWVEKRNVPQQLTAAPSSRA